jgi:hypothetical protein
MHDAGANEFSRTSLPHLLTPVADAELAYAGGPRPLSARIGLAWVLVLLFVLIAGAKFAARGPVLAWSLSQDFKTFYAASRAWSLGMNPYDHELLNAIVERAGASGGEHTWEDEPSIYPPMTYAALSPIALLPWGPARLLWCVLNLACLTLLIGVLCRFGGLAPLGMRMVLLLGAVLALQPSSAAMRVGQLSILVATLGVASLLLTRRGRDWSGGCLLGLALALKPQLALVFVAPALLSRRWKALLAGALIVSAIAIVSVLRIHAVSAWPASWLSNLSSAFAPAGVNGVAASSVHNRNMVNLQYPLRLIIDSFWMADVLALAIGAVLAAPALERLSSEGAGAANFLEDISLLAVVELLVMYHRDYDAVLLALPLAWSLSPHVRLRRALPAVLLIAVFFLPILHVLYALDQTAARHPLTSSLPVRFLVWPYQTWALLGLAGWLWYCRDRSQQQTNLAYLA